MRQLTLAFGKINEVLHRLGRIFVEQAADDLAFAAVEYGVGSGLAGHGDSRSFPNRSWSFCRRTSPASRNHHRQLNVVVIMASATVAFAASVAGALSRCERRLQCGGAPELSVFSQQASSQVQCG